MPCVCTSMENIELLAEAVDAEPKLEVSIDLETMTVTYGEESFSITMPESAREALLSARWDPIQELLDNDDAIQERAKALPYV